MPTRELYALPLFNENKVAEKKKPKCIKFYPAAATTKNP